MTKAQKAALKTLAYADIFDYPLTITEIHKWLISDKAIESSVLEAQLRGRTLKDSSGISHLKINKVSYYHLPGQSSTIKTRQSRQRFSLIKLKKAQKIVNFIKLIPSVKMIAITGALAMNNSNHDDDIDLMIVTKTNCLWLTRFLVNSFLDLFNLRRKPHQTKIQDKFCVNLLLDESALIIRSPRNLYTAHEIAQIKPLHNKDQAYQKFITVNSWVSKFLPHALNNIEPIFPNRTSTQKAPLLENLAYKLQHLYMKKRLTREKVALHSAFFHPRPTGNIVLKAYQKRLKALKI